MEILPTSQGETRCIEELLCLKQPLRRVAIIPTAAQLRSSWGGSEILKARSPKIASNSDGGRQIQEPRTDVSNLGGDPPASRYHELQWTGFRISAANSRRPL
jgi:hypothetical protein